MAATAITDYSFSAYEHMLVIRFIGSVNGKNCGSLS